MRTLLSFGKWLSQWWRSDRIRVARHTGRLLRLRKRDCLIIGDRAYVIIDGWIEDDRTSPSVEAAEDGSLAKSIGSPSMRPLIESTKHGSRNACRLLGTEFGDDDWLSTESTADQQRPRAVHYRLRELSAHDRLAYVASERESLDADTLWRTDGCHLVIPLQTGEAPHDQIERPNYIAAHLVTDNTEQELMADEIVVLARRRS